MNNYKEQIEEQLRRASWASDKTEKEKILEKAIQMAEFHKDFDLMVESKLEYINCVVFEGYHEKALPQFAWLLAQLDNNPDKIGKWNQHTILWSYKWLITNLPGYTNIPLEKILETFADMEKRFLAFDGDNLKAINYFKSKVYLSLGNLEEAKKYHDLYLKSKKAKSGLLGLSDCEACVLDNEVNFYLDRLDLDKAIEKGLYIIQNNKRCREVPLLTYSSLCMAYTNKEEYDIAEKYYKLGVKAFPFNENFIDTWSNYIYFLSKTKKFTNAIKLFNKSFHHLPKTLNQKKSLEFSAASLVLFKSYREHYPKKKAIKLDIEENNIVFSEDGNYDIDNIIAVFDQKARSIAIQLDSRNQNSYYTERIKNFFLIQ
jgi:tetratricopeptide (TPR) repeat protein